MRLLRQKLRQEYKFSLRSMLRWYATNLLIPIKIRPKSNKMMERTSINRTS